MLKKSLFLIVLAASILALAACSSLPIPGAAAASNNQAASTRQNGQGGQNPFSDPSKLPVESKLAIGMLKLEGTNLAITNDEAKNLLPLWQAVKSLSTNSNTTQDEITALFKQIEQTLTPDQVAAIQKMTWTQTDMSTLMKQYGIEFAQGGAGGNLTADQRATRVAQFAANGGGTRTGGGAGFTGGPGGGGGGFGGGGFGGGGQGGANGQVQRTPAPGQSARRNLGGLNYLFADPLIKLLQTKAGA